MVTCFAFVCAMLCVSHTVSAAQGHAPPAGSEVAPQPSPAATIDQQPAVNAAGIRERLEKVNDLITDATPEDDPLRTEKDRLEKAIAFLTEVGKERDLATEFVAKTQSAPQREKEITEELASRPAEIAKPNPPKDSTLEHLEQELSAAKTQLQVAEKLKADVERDRTDRQTRQAAIPTEIASITSQIEELNTQLKAPPAEGDSPELAQARRWRRQTERMYLEARLERVRKEDESYRARGALLDARKKQAERNVADAQQLVGAWDAIVNAKRRDEAEAEARKREAERLAVAGQADVVKAEFKTNADLARELEEVTQSNERRTTKKRQVGESLKRWRAAYENVKGQEKQIGLTEAIGLRLRSQRNQLPDLRSLKRTLKEQQKEMKRVQSRVFDLEAEDISDIDAAVRDQLDAAEPIDEARRADIERLLTEALTVQQKLNRDLRQTYEQVYFDNTLVPLNSEQQALVSLVEEFREFIDERILWIQSTEFIRAQDAARVGGALLWLVDASNWAEIPVALWSDITTNPVGFALAALSFLLIALVQRRSRHLLRDISLRVRRPFSDAFILTLQALVLTMLMTALWPILLWTITWRLSFLENPSEFVIAFIAALNRTAWLLFAGEFVRHLCRPAGLAESHFRWKQRTIEQVRGNVRLLMMIVLPLVFVRMLTASQSVDAHYHSLGRLLFIVSMMAVAFAIRQVFHPSRGVLRAYLEEHDGGWLNRLRYVWYALLIVIPLALGIVAGLGYLYTAVQLAGRLVETMFMIVVLVVLNALILRWLTVAQRRLAIVQARKKYAQQAKTRAEQKAAAKAGGDVSTNETPPDQPPIEQMELDVQAVSLQTRKLVRTMFGFAIVIGLFIVWSDVLPAFNILHQVELWNGSTETGVSNVSSDVSQVMTSDGSQSTSSLDGADGSITDGAITLADLGLAIIMLAITVAVSRNIPGLLEITILQRLPITQGGRYATTTVVRYAIVLVGIVLAFNAIGIGWSKVQWLAAAVTVGLGFGLQEIFANFVSGLIILFERPIRVGDVVTVGDISGTVSRIRIRATTIVDWDRKELVIPNKEFVTGQIVNWSLSDAVLRVRIPVGIAYGSDIAKARELLRKVAKESKRVLTEPSPQVLFWNFGASSLDFEVRVFIPNIDHFVLVRDELHEAIDAAFRKAGIEIAFPQRDIHVRSIKAVLPVLREDHPDTETAS